VGVPDISPWLGIFQREKQLTNPIHNPNTKAMPLARFLCLSSRRRGDGEGMSEGGLNIQRKCADARKTIATRNVYLSPIDILPVDTSYHLDLYVLSRHVFPLSFKSTVTTDI